ncbi:MAG: hypothetical protein ACPIOQ_24560 [Promethearchaeia archaeon]
MVTSSATLYVLLIIAVSAGRVSAFGSATVDSMDAASLRILREAELAKAEGTKCPAFALKAASGQGPTAIAGAVS